jgi:hypothetical protein
MAETTTGRRSRAGRTADQAKRDQGQRSLKAVPDSQPKPPEPPQPEITVETVQRPYFKPVVTFPGGRKFECQHPYLHETESAGAQCGRRIAALGQFVK